MPHTALSATSIAEFQPRMRRYSSVSPMPELRAYMKLVKLSTESETHCWPEPPKRPVERQPDGAHVPHELSMDRSPSCTESMEEPMPLPEIALPPKRHMSQRCTARMGKSVQLTSRLYMKSARALSCTMFCACEADI